MGAGSHQCPRSHSALRAPMHAPPWWRGVSRDPYIDLARADRRADRSETRKAVGIALAAIAVFATLVALSIAGIVG